MFKKKNDKKSINTKKAYKILYKAEVLPKGSLALYIAMRKDGKQWQ